MKKITFILLLTPLFLQAQVKVKNLPTTSSGTIHDYLIKDDSVGISGSTKKISVIDFIALYLKPRIDSLSINKVPYSNAYKDVDFNNNSIKNIDSVFTLSGIFDGKTTTIGDPTGLASERVYLQYMNSQEYGRLQGKTGVGLTFGTDNVQDRMLITQTGNVGIGNITPSSMLEIGNGSTTRGGVILNDDGTNQPFLQLKNSITNNRTFNLYSGHNATGSFSIADLTAGNTNRFIIDSVGKIRIPNLTAGQAVFTDASKNLVSNAITGSGSVAMSVSPTFTGTVTATTMPLGDNSTKIASTAFVTSAIAAVGGIWYITNASGISTYYATYALASAAATSGQTLQLNADINETGNVQYILKAGVNWNLNGHTISFNNASASINIDDNTVACIISIENGVIKNLQSGEIILNIQNPATTIDFSGVKFINDNGYCIYSYGILNNFYAEGLSPVRTFGGTINNFDIKCTGNGYAYLQTDGIAKNGRIVSISATNPAVTLTSMAYNIDASNTGNDAIAISGGICNTCIAEAKTPGSYATYIVGGGICNNCVSSTSTSSAAALYIANGTYNGGTVNNLSTGWAIRVNSASSYISNASIYAAGKAAIYFSDNGVLKNCTVKSGYNNSAGHAITMDAGLLEDITNCALITTNSSANCINASGASNVTYALNTYKTATTPVNVNVTQYINVANVLDAQGNILINH